jgi:prepilin peptidase CpaA
MNLQNLVLNFFTAVMAVAAFEDFRRLTIPNLLPLLLCAAWPLYVAATPTQGGALHGALAALGCALAVFLGGAVLFARGWLGGGDVKLLSAATLWAGAPQTPALLVLTGILGGVLALVLLSPIGGLIAPASRPRSGWPGGPGGPAEAPTSSIPVPYGVAIAAAGLIVVVTPHIV